MYINFMVMSYICIRNQASELHSGCMKIAVRRFDRLFAKSARGTLQHFGECMGCKYKEKLHYVVPLTPDF